MLDMCVTEVECILVILVAMCCFFVISHKPSFLYDIIPDVLEHGNTWWKDSLWTNKCCNKSLLTWKNSALISSYNRTSFHLISVSHTLSIILKNDWYWSATFVSYVCDYTWITCNNISMTSSIDIAVTSCTEFILCTVINYFHHCIFCIRHHAYTPLSYDREKAMMNSLGEF